MRREREAQSNGDRIRAVDLFSGCGGLSAGLEGAGIQVDAALDSWMPALDVYRANFRHPALDVDLSNVDVAVRLVRSFNPDLIVGGPPCQEFSHAGSRVEGERASLSVAFAETVVGVKPNVFVMENVDRARHSDAYHTARLALSNAGYGLTEVVLDASLCGVPQKRKRFFCIGAVDEPDDFLSHEIAANQSQESMTVREYLGMELGLEHYYRHPRNYSRRGVFSIDEPAPTMRGVNRPVPAGYPGHRGDSAPISSRVRALTLHERARLQTFPKSFKWPGVKTHLEQMIGNAVPVELGAFVGRAVVSYLEKRREEGPSMGRVSREVVR